MKNVIFVGWVNQGKPPVDGETTKNQILIAEIKKYCRVTVLDFYKKNCHPWVFLQALWAFVSQPKATIIFSTSAKNIYGILKLFKVLGLRRDIIHWVIGGAFADNVQKGIFRADVFGMARHTLVESPVMAKQLEACGIKGVRQLPNFKPIPYYPTIKTPPSGGWGTRGCAFVFLSRIMPEKGCDYILEAARQLNSQGLTERFSIDFYGKIDDGYIPAFETALASLPNVHYAGYLDLTQPAGYDRLAEYDVMLFPTYWKGEGFAGVFIDAFIAGLPLIASEWAHNRQFLREGETALFIPVHDVQALVRKMQECIEGRVDVLRMKNFCQTEAKKYCTSNVITPSLLKEIDLL